MSYIVEKFSIPCPVCDGMGERVRERYNPTVGKIETWQEECWACHGTKKMWFVEAGETFEGGNGDEDRKR